MAEPAFAEMPDQHSNRILTVLQIRRDLDRIVISIIRRRSPFQSPFKDDQAAVYPQPIFAIGSDTGGKCLRDLVYMNGFTESQPGIRRALATFRIDPMRFPAGFGPAGSDTSDQQQQQEIVFHGILV